MKCSRATCQRVRWIVERGDHFDQFAMQFQALVMAISVGDGWWGGGEARGPSRSLPCYYRAHI